MHKIKEKIYKAVFVIPFIALSILTISSFLIKPHYVHQLHGNEPKSGYQRLINNYLLQTDIRNNIIGSNTVLDNVKYEFPYNQFAWQYHIATPSVCVDYNQTALNNSNSEIGNTNKLPIALLHSKSIKIITINNGKRSIVKRNEDNCNITLTAPIKYLTKKQYQEQQIQKHEYKIFCHNPVDSSKSNTQYLSAYVPLTKIGNEYCYPIGHNQYINAKYIDKINGYPLVAQNIPCYSKTFNSYGCIANAVVGQFDKSGNQNTNFSFADGNEFYVSNAHLNSLDPSYPISNWYIGALTTYNCFASIPNNTRTEIMNTTENVNASNVMPAVYLSNNKEPFPLNGSKLKYPSYFSDKLNHKFNENNSKYRYLPYVTGSMAFYGINPISKYFFDFKHLKYGQVDKIIDNYKLHSFASPKSYYYNLHDTDYHHFGLFISDSAQNKDWACDNTLIKTPSKRHDFLLNSGYYIPYQYEQSINYMLNGFNYPFFYRNNIFYHKLVNSFQCPYWYADLPLGVTFDEVELNPKQFKYKAPTYVTN